MVTTMRYHNIKSSIILLGAAMLFATFSQVALENGRMLLGSWGDEEYTSIPIMSFYESGVAEHYFVVPDYCNHY